MSEIIKIEGADKAERIGNTLKRIEKLLNENDKAVRIDFSITKNCIRVRTIKEVPENEGHYLTPEEKALADKRKADGRKDLWLSIAGVLGGKRYRGDKILGMDALAEFKRYLKKKRTMVNDDEIPVTLDIFKRAFNDHLLKEVRK